MKAKYSIYAGLLAMSILVIYVTVQQSSILAVKETQFTRDTLHLNQQLEEYRKNSFISLKNNNNTIKYLYDNFDTYGNVNSRLIDGFETKEGLQTDSAIELGLRQANYEGDRALALRATGVVDAFSIKKRLDSPINISRWKGGGYASMWMFVPQSRGVEHVTFRMGDSSGAFIELEPVYNLQTDAPDTYDKNDMFPDLKYPEQTHSAEWTDFSLKEGWNFIPWRIDTDGLKNKGNVNFEEVSWYEIDFGANKSIRDQTVVIDDLRIQDGLQKGANALAGNWFPPLGMPQYGVFDVNHIASNDFVLKLQNVRQSQYPSNGDHGRVLSKDATPESFAMRVQFSLNNIGHNKSSLNNTWLRIFYDFDPEYDPGHDWFGTYFSLEYQKMGMITVIPLERFSMQTQEPLDTTKNSSFRKTFTPKEGQLYEYNLTVNRQDAAVAIYEVKGEDKFKKATVRYKFDRKRYEDKRYPLGIEITGDVKATIYEVEVTEL